MDFRLFPLPLIQAKGKSDITAKLHMLELPIYVVLLIVFIKNFGVAGAAIAWLIRVIIDYVLLSFYLNKYIFSQTDLVRD